MRTSKLILLATTTGILSATSSVAALERPIGTDVVALGTGAEFAADAPMLDWQYAPVQRGEWRFDLASTEVSVDFDAAYWVVQENHPGMTLLTDAGPAGPIGRDLMLLSVERLAGPTGAFDGWLEANDAMLMDAPVEASVGGRSGLRFDIDLTSVDEDYIVDFARTSSGESVAFESGYEYRVWWIEDGDVAIVVSSDGTGHPLLYQAEMLLDTMMFAPTPA